MTEGRPLDSFRVGAGHAGKTRNAIGGLQLFFFKRRFEPGGISITSGEGREGLEIEFSHMSNDFINHV